MKKLNINSSLAIKEIVSKDELKLNYYALYLAIKKRYSVSEALSYMGISTYFAGKPKKEKIKLKTG